MYILQIDKRVIKILKKIPDSDYKSIKSKILALTENPRPHGCKKLRGRSAYRIRQGDYRIIYEIRDKLLLVLIVSVRNRKDAYRK